jgi:hypothetical protein
MSVAATKLVAASAAMQLSARELVLVCLTLPQRGAYIVR